MSRRASRRSRTPEVVELNITAFLNLMVILVPFLLITAVFTHLTVLQINLPTSSQADSSTKKSFEVQVILTKEQFIVADSQGHVIKKIETYPTGGHYRLLNQVLRQVKASYPDKTNITLLSQPDTDYDTLIQTMDAVRVYHIAEESELVQVELFPDISIGDAPALKKK